MNKIEEIFSKYNNDNEGDIVPATSQELKTFIHNCNANNIPVNIVDDLVEYYKLSNSFFNYYKCDDSAIFEWYKDDGCLWLGQKDLWTFRCLVDKRKYSIGDASNDSFGPKYEFDTIDDMLESFLSGKTI